MKRELNFVAVLLLCIPCAMASEPEASRPIERPSRPGVGWSMSVDFGSLYQSRGFLMSRGPIIQTEFSIARGAVEFSSWSSVTANPGAFHVNEQDFTLTFEKQLSRKVSGSAGYIFYSFPNCPEDRFTQEIFSSVKYESRVNLEAAVFQDLLASGGTYALLSASKSLTLRKIGLDLSASLGYNRKQFIPISTFSDLGTSLTLNLPWKNGWTMSPYLAASKSLDSRYFGNFLWGGVRFSYGK